MVNQALINHGLLLLTRTFARFHRICQNGMSYEIPRLCLVVRTEGIVKLLNRSKAQCEILSEILSINFLNNESSIPFENQTYSTWQN